MIQLLFYTTSIILIFTSHALSFETKEYNYTSLYKLECKDYIKYFESLKVYNLGKNVTNKFENYTSVKKTWKGKKRSIKHIDIGLNSDNINTIEFRSRVKLTNRIETGVTHDFMKEKTYYKIEFKF